jgi:tetratricopeptide (TPR) repeat protein
MGRSGIIYILLLIILSRFLVSAAESFSQYENEYEIAYEEKEYAFKLVPEFYHVLIGKGNVHSLNVNSLKWKYRNELLRHPENAFLAFCIGELYRYNKKYEGAFRFYDTAFEKAGRNVFRHTLLLELFSQRGLLQWQLKEEERIVELKKDSGALSLPLLSRYFFVRGNEAAQSGLEDEIEKNLILSKKLDPYNIGIRFFYARFLLMNRRFEFFDEFLALVHTLFIDFKAKIFFLIFSYNFLFLFVAILLSSFVIAYFIKYFPFVTSKIITLTPRNLSGAIKSFMSITLLLLPLIWTIPSLYAFLFILIIPIPFLERNERWVVQSLVLLLFILSLLGGVQSQAYTAMDPTNRIELLDNMSKSRFDPKWIRKSDSLIAVSSEDFSLYFLKGLQFKRGGFFDEAEENYRKALRIAPNFYQTYNNLGNVLFWKGKIDSSIKYYELAVQYEPMAAAPHYNLGQAYLRKLQFDISFLQIKKASQLDFELISKQTTSSKEENNHFLIDQILPRELLWIEFFSQENDINIFPWKYIGFDHRIFSLILMSVFLISFIIPRITKNIKNQCPICSSPISPGNSRLFENLDICWRCYSELSSVRSLDIRERLKGKIKLAAQTRFFYTDIFWGLFLPGLGHLQSGKTRKGAFFLLVFSILCSLLFLTKITKIRFYMPFLDENNYGLYIIILLITLVYLFSLLSLFLSGSGERK